MTSPITAISATDITRRAMTPAPDLQVLAQRFEQLMSKDFTKPNLVPAPTSAVSPQVSQAIHSLDEANRVLNDDMHRFILDAPNMDMKTMTAVNMELTLRTASTQAQLTMCSAVAKSGKDGLTTLIKNQ